MGCNHSSFQPTDNLIDEYHGNDVSELHGECLNSKKYRSTCRKRGLKLATLNANDLRSKIDQIRQLVATRKIDIFAIYETKLNEKVKVQLGDINEFDLKRLDRNRQGGSIAL